MYEKPPIKKEDKVSKVNFVAPKLPIPLHAITDYGIEMLNQPIHPAILQSTAEVFNKLDKDAKKKFNLKLQFEDKPLQLKNTILTPDQPAEGSYDPATRIIRILTGEDQASYKFKLAHEIGHALGIEAGIENEYLADAFARSIFPTHYSYKNNPYIKESWQEGYAPPNPLPIPKFPAY